MKIDIPEDYYQNKDEITIHVDDCDVYSMDIIVALIVYPMLEKLKEVQTSAPHTDNTDVPEDLRSTSVTTGGDDPDENYFKRWDWIMEEMIWTFRQIGTGVYLKYNLQSNRIKNGLRLFSKYYFSLGD